MNLPPGSQTAIVFGPEPTGLANQELQQCHSLIHIPTDNDYPALNLAQAVTICIYEWYRLALKQVKLDEPKLSEKIPAIAIQNRMYDRLKSGLEGIHFLYGPKASSLMHAIRYLISRAKPREKEVEILFGLAKQLHWVADQLTKYRPDWNLDWRPSTKELKHIDPAQHEQQQMGAGGTNPAQE